MRFLALTGLGVLLAACGPTAVAPAPAPVACGAGQQAMVRDALFFGQSIPGGGTVADSAWEAFLAESVTPAFPSGFTILSAVGQWREDSGHIVREPTRILVLLHPPSAGTDSTLRGIKAEYIQRFRQEAVLWERTGACISF
ncbi:MAG TPA: DUF3574 domain-containing protein [Gemmatimonadales bacterium]|nr:DUF3574 domain-containing protein [Gemmatimonadales bacterium]